MLMTAVMFIVLAVSYALMFALVKFTENIIAAPALERAPAVDRDAAPGNIGTPL
jgi:hypothetical protein